MSARRLALFVIAVLILFPASTSCAGSGAVRAVKGFARALIGGDAEQMNRYLDEDLKFPDEDMNLWEEMEYNIFGIDPIYLKKAAGTMLRRAEYKLDELDGDDATVEVTVNLEFASQLILNATGRKGLRDDVKKALRRLDREDFVETLDVELELIDGEWLITDIEDWDFLYTGY